MYINSLSIFELLTYLAQLSIQLLLHDKSFPTVPSTAYQAMIHYRLIALRPLSTLVSPRKRAHRDVTSTTTRCALTPRHSLSTRARVRGGICKQLGFFQAASKGLQVYTLVQYKQEREYKIYRGRDGRHTY